VYSRSSCNRPCSLLAWAGNRGSSKSRGVSRRSSGATRLISSHDTRILSLLQEPAPVTLGIVALRRIGQAGTFERRGELAYSEPEYVVRRYRDTSNVPRGEMFVTKDTGLFVARR